MKMGAHKFQADYIEYLEESNANLQDKLMNIREFQNKLLNERLQNRHCDITLKEITKMCNSTCEAIDNLFENFTATMNSMKNVLLWKSQISQLPKKISYALKAGDDSTVEMAATSDNVDEISSQVNELPDARNGKKRNTAKVSPMIEGHIISAPTIHLNRVSRVRASVGPQTNHSMGTQLSPIIETSPSTSPHTDPRPLFREARISLQRVKLNNFRGNMSISEDSHKENTMPKVNYRSDRFKFRKPFDSLKAGYQFRLMRKKIAENERENDEEMEEDESNDVTPNNVPELEDNSDAQGRNDSGEVDPMEGPSWLLDQPQRSEQSQSSGLSSFRYNFINFKRPNYASFNRSTNDVETKKQVLDFNENAQMGNFEMIVNDARVRPGTINLVKLNGEKNVTDENEGSLFEESSSNNSSKEEESEGDCKSFCSHCSGRKTGCSRGSELNRNRVDRGSISGNGGLLDNVGKVTPKTSTGSVGILPEDGVSVSKSETSATPRNCFVHLNRQSCGSAKSNKKNSLKNGNGSPALARRSTESSGRRSMNSGVPRRSSIRKTENPVRAKRRAAELKLLRKLKKRDGAKLLKNIHKCYQKIHSLGMESEEKLPKSKKRTREKRKNRK